MTAYTCIYTLTDISYPHTYVEREVVCRDVKKVILYFDPKGAFKN